MANRFCQALALHKLERAWELAVQIEKRSFYLALSAKAMELLHVEMAMLFCDYQRAQDLFLASSRPVAALEMRKDLMQWEQALKLANVLAPAQVPDICIHYGNQLEVRDDHDGALRMFEDALSALDNDGHRAITDDLVPPTQPRPRPAAPSRPAPAA